MANVQIPDALLVKSYVAGDESALATLITDTNQKFTVLSILKFLTEI